MIAMTREQLRSVCPSIFATQPISGVSSRYAFLPSIAAIEAMEELGFVPVKASQTITRLPDRRPYARHMVRLRHVSHLSAELFEEVGEIVLCNAHDRSAAYSLSAGIYRTVCTNGLTIMSSDFGSFAVRHKGKDTRKAITDATHEIVSRLPRLFETITEWKGIILSRTQQTDLATQAHALKPSNIRAVDLLTARRPADYTDADGNRDLWTSYNTIEENFMRGGLQGRNARGRRISTRAIRSVTEDIRIHRLLWGIAENFASN